jgi:hypothetical protein
MVIGGVIWGSLAAITGPGYTLFGAAVLFLVSLLLSARLSIDFTAKLKERISNVLPANVKSEAMVPLALATDLSPAEC